MINYFLKTGLVKMDFSERIRRKTLKDMQCVIVKDQSQNQIFNENAHHMLLLYSGFHLMLWRVPSDDVSFILCLRVFTVTYMFAIFYKCLIL